MQNLVVFLDPNEDAINTCESGSDICFKGGKMFLNRFCIDEDHAFELSGVHYFNEPGKYLIKVFLDGRTNEIGKGNSCELIKGLNSIPN